MKTFAEVLVLHLSTDFAFVTGPFAILLAFVTGPFAILLAFVTGPFAILLAFVTGPFTILTLPLLQVRLLY